ncbi:hypothetical protein DTO027B9_2807 [Paecilomyces variotii]|nr:hypothetical protein DTO027B9_2807 [Paecilomyces variotii]
MIYAYLVRKVTHWIMDLLDALEYLTIGEYMLLKESVKNDEEKAHQGSQEEGSKSPGPLALPCSLPGWNSDGYENGRHPFFTLPTELVLLITSYVPIVEKASLALTCKHFLCMLGNESVRLLDDTTTHNGDYAHISIQMNRWRLLKFLEKDFPNHFVCHSCAHFHLNLPIKPTYVSYYPPTSLCVTRTNAFWRGVWGWCVGYEKVHGIMMAHRNKWTYGMSLDDFQYERRISMSKFRLRIAREGTTAETVKAIAPAPDDEEDKIECHEVVFASIACNEFLLDMTATFFVDRGALALEEYVVNERCPNHGLSILGDLNRLRTMGSPGRVCMDCHAQTDIRIQGSKEKPEMEEVKVRTVISLGSGEESSYDIWKKACGHDPSKLFLNS